MENRFGNLNIDPSALALKNTERSLERLLEEHSKESKASFTKKSLLTIGARDLS